MVPVRRGRVEQVLPAGVWTYLRLRTDHGRVWVAVPFADVQPGDRVETPRGLYMRDFRSRSLGRTFPEVYLAPRVKVLGRRETARPAKPRPASPPSRIAPPPGGVALAELWRRRRELAGREVVVRGRVVKFVPRVLGKNWVHLDDGSGRPVTACTAATVAVGEVVTLRGKVALERDLGYGYRYELLLEEARPVGTGKR